MRRLSPSLSWFARAALLALAALPDKGCTGTPLPEPPDELPRPDWGVADVVTTEVSPPSPGRLVLQRTSGAVQPGTRVWAINLDAPQTAPAEADATSIGGFQLAIEARAGDRIRIVSRTDRQHSAPLDLIAVDNPVSNLLSAQPLGNIGLACLRLAPPESVVLSGNRGALHLENGCGVAVNVTQAVLRLGDQGLRLRTPPSKVDADERAELVFEDTQDAAAKERLDVLLLDVQAADGRSGRYAVDVFSAVKAP